jgi:predicted NBD/HSP70 family sugar kinase
VPVASILRKALGVPVRVERSIHLAAMYEKWANPRNDDRTILVVSLRTGVGISLMHRGELITGQRGFDGEIGHTVVDVDGRPCECGSRGCLETFISASAICALAAEAMRTGRATALASRVAAGEPLRPELIYRLARDGDADSADIVRYVGRYLGIAVCNLINLLAPHEVVICGAIDVAGDLLLDVVREQMEQRVLPRMRERVNVRLSHEQEKLPLLGAAALVAQEWFQLPRLRHAEVEDDLERETVRESP